MYTTWQPRIAVIKSISRDMYVTVDEIRLRFPQHTESLVRSALALGLDKGWLEQDRGLGYRACVDEKVINHELLRALLKEQRPVVARPVQIKNKKWWDYDAECPCGHLAVPSHNRCYEHAGR